MWWLIIQILIFLLLAAALGAAMAWWWFKRQYEDVTERFTAFQKAANEEPAALTKAEFDAGLASGFSGLKLPDLIPVEDKLSGLERAVSSFAVPETDLSPVLERLEMVEAHVAATDPDIEALNARFGRLEGSLATMSSNIQALGVPDTDAIADKVSELSSSITEKQWVDLRPLEARMARLEGAIQSIALPEPDLGPLHSGIARLELLIENLKPTEPDFGPVHSQLEHIESKLADLDQNLASARDTDTGLSSVSEQVSSISSMLAGFQTPDLAPLRDRLAVIERMLGTLEPDLRPVQQQIERLEIQMRSPNQDLDAIQSRLSGLDTLIGTLSRTQVDLEPVHRQLELIKAHLMAPNQNVDVLPSRIASLADSLAGIEASLGAMRAQMNVASTGMTGLEPIERRLAALQDAFLGLRQPDLTPLLAQVRAMDKRVDLGAVESRLTAIEYSLAGVHQMLRSRGESSFDAMEEISSEPDSNVQPLVATEPLETRTWPQETDLTIKAPRVDLTNDPLSAERRPDDQANLLLRAAFGGADDLEQISGVGPTLRDMLNNIGVYYFWQISEWTPENVEWVDEKLEHFKGRITRDAWVEQAKMLAAQPGAAQRPGT